jgi:ubiquinone/menaquinone biosynthesis C-methylase UbiE
MKPIAKSFDGLARVYLGLERLAFGSDLEAARFCHLESLRGCGRVLILGEGDGRYLTRLVRRFPDLRVECLDGSAAMLGRAAARLTEEERLRVVFRQADARLAELGEGKFDAVVTLFFLDCFTGLEVRGLVERVGRALRSRAVWVWSDFAIPTSGWRRWRAELWVGGLYGVFRWRTGLTARRLPPSEALLRAAGWTAVVEKNRQAGLLRSVVYERG